MIAGTIWNQVITTLQGNPTLSKYVKYVFDGQRVNIEPESLPCIMLEPVMNNDIVQHVNNVQKILFSINIFAFSSANYSEFPKTIVGDDSYKGILDIEQDIKACLTRSSTLGERVIDIQFEPTEFEFLDFEKYPVRGLLMPIKILYQQVNET
jgi:hypothetical protein